MRIYAVFEPCLLREYFKCLLKIYHRYLSYFHQMPISFSTNSPWSWPYLVQVTTFLTIFPIGSLNDQLANFTPQGCKHRSKNVTLQLEVSYHPGMENQRCPQVQHLLEEKWCPIPHRLLQVVTLAFSCCTKYQAIWKDEHMNYNWIPLKCNSNNFFSNLYSGIFLN